MMLSPSLSIQSEATKSRGTTPIPPVPEPIGVIYDKTLGDNIADWTLTNPTLAVTFASVLTDYVMAGTGGTGGSGASNLFKDFLQLNITDHAVTCLPKWKIRIEFTTGTVNIATSFGFSAGIISTNSFEFRDTLIRLRQDSGAAGDLGRFYFYNSDTSTTGTANQDQPTGGFTVVTATRYIFEAEKTDEITIVGRLYDSTGTTLHNEKTIIQTPPGGTVAKVLHNTGKFAISQHGGTNTIHRVTISSDALKNVPYGAFGNSHFYGGKSTTLAGSMFHAAMTGLDYTLCPGWADRAVDMETRMAEMLVINPAKLMIECGSNDVKATTWATTGLTAFTSMVTQAQAAGIVVKGMAAPARNDVNVSAVESDMNSLLGASNVVQGYTLTKQAANSNLLGIYNSGDGIHGDDDMHVALTSPIQTVFI